VASVDASDGRLADTGPPSLIFRAGRRGWSARALRVRTEITDCTDLEQLNTWIRRAVTVDKVQDLFD
jgi:hypothetical protein